MLTAAPAGAPKAIAAKPGDEITLSGRIMGNATPGDDCETPWDSCCDSPEDKKRGIATIQIVDAGGRVLKEPVEGVGGLEKLATVTVTGKVAKGSSPDLLMVNATAIRAAAVK